MRYYPENWLSSPNEPTKEKFDIIEIENIGEAVISKYHFTPGDVAFVFSGIVLSERKLFTLEVNKDTHIYDPFFMGKIAHSCKPNCHVDMANRSFLVIRDIFPGDVITMDYKQTESKLFRGFDCRCGHDNCQKTI